MKKLLRLSALVAITVWPGCDGRTPLANPTSVPSTTSEAPRTLSGQIFELLPGSRAPAVNIPVIAVVVTTSGCAAPCTSMTRSTYANATTGPDGQYSFAELPAGSVAVLAGSPLIHEQACGAGAELGPATRLDAEITLSSNPQRSPTLPPLRVSGQVYAMTPAGRVGLSGAWIYIHHHLPDLIFLTTVTDTDGHYAACGIPPNWRMLFDTLKPGYEARSADQGWHTFRTDTTLDIEMRPFK